MGCDDHSNQISRFTTLPNRICEYDFDRRFLIETTFSSLAKAEGSSAKFSGRKDEFRIYVSFYSLHVRPG
jgi:hypothetical protein